MKYDVDLQEMDSRLDARGTCTEESAGAVEGNEKKNARSWAKRDEETSRGTEGAQAAGWGGNTRAIIMLPMP